MSQAPGSTDPRLLGAGKRARLFRPDTAQDRKDLVLWGDCGVGNFFIRREDLLRRDFSRVLYIWDCS